MALQNRSKPKLEGWLWFSSLTRRGRHLSWGSSVQGQTPQVLGKQVLGKWALHTKGGIWRKQNTTFCISQYLFSYINVLQHTIWNKETRLWTRYSAVLATVLNLSRQQLLFIHCFLCVWQPCYIFARIREFSSPTKENAYHPLFRGEPAGLGES